jgi:hypothetical protein
MAKIFEAIVKCFVIALACIILSRPAYSCNVTGAWTIAHANGAFAEMDVQLDKDGNLIGTGSEGQQTGSLKGSRDGRNVEFTIRWRPNGAVGVYTGRISKDGEYMTGTNYNKVDRRQHTTWVIERRFDGCN